MACTDVQTIQAGNGTKTQFSFDFPYIFKSEIHVYFWNAVTKEYDEILTTDATYPWQITDANPTIVEFTGTAPPSPATPVDPGESTVDNVKIRRITKVDDIRALFNPGSAIRSDDLNKNFEQLRYAIQEANCAGIPDDVDQYLKDYYWDRFDNTIYDGDTWVSDDTKIATTASIDDRVDSKIDAAITNDIGTDGTGITVTDDGDGTITLGLADNTIDFSKIKNDDIITYAEQPTVTTSDNNIFTASAAERQFDTIVQTSTPSGSDWEVGKTWLQNDVDKTLSIWNGSAWVAVASGGSFTELTKVIYVDAVNGDDTLAGHRISNPKKTIKAAIDDINADSDGDGSIVLVAPGIYGEEFPISIQKNDVAIVGQSLRNCIVHPAIPAADQAGYDVDVPEANELATMFEVNSGTYIYGLTLTGMKASGTRGGNSLDTDSTYGLPTNQGWNFAFRSGATIKKSPYIQNCTNFSDSQINNVNFTPHTPGEGAAGDLDSGPSGGGILIDGSTPAANSPLRSMVCDSYTHTALDGPGIFVTNNGYCQATSSYSFFNHFHLKTKNGGQANLAASTTDFGSHSLIADGRSPYAIFTATTTATASDGSTTFTIGAPTARTATPLPWHGNATRPQDNMLVDIGGNTYPILSAVAAGSGWTVTISRPDPNDRSTNLGLNGAVSSGASVSFFLRSMIASSGHTMEYVGSGTDYTALPENGGVPDDTKQLTELNNGKIWAAITDHRGTFKVGDTFEVNQQTGFVSIDPTASNSVTKTGVTGNAIIPAGTTAQRGTPANGHLRYNTSNHKFEGYVNGAWGVLGNLVDDLTPQLGGDLDVNGQSIVSTSNGNITLDPDGTGNTIVSSGNVGIGTTSPGTTLDARGIVSIGSSSGANAILQKSAVPGGSYNLTLTGGGGLTSESATTPTDALAGSVIKLMGGNPATDPYGGGIQYYANGSTTPNAAGNGNQHVFYTRSGVNTYSERVRIDHLGGVRINADGDATQLIIKRATSNEDNGLQLQDQVGNTKAFFNLEGTATNRLQIGGNNEIAFFTGSTFGNPPSNERLRIDSSGNVGIGTSSPSYALDVQDVINIRKDGSNLAKLQFQGTSTRIQYSDASGNLEFYTNSTKRGQWGYTGGLFVTSGGLILSGGDIAFSGADRSIINNDNNALAFGTNATERMRIQSNGNVNIGRNGNHTEASARLAVFKSGASESWSVRPGTAVTNQIDFLSYNFGTNTYLHLKNIASEWSWFNGNAGEMMRINSSGALGFEGANFGSAGQVLVSNGSSAAPSWEQVTPTAVFGWDHDNDTYGLYLPGTSVKVSDLTGTVNIDVQSRIRRCVINNSGVVQYYLDADDSDLKSGDWLRIVETEALNTAYTGTISESTNSLLRVGVPAWAAGTFTLGQRVTHSGSLWECIAATTTATPAAGTVASNLTGTDGQVVVEIPAFSVRYGFLNGVHTREVKLGCNDALIAQGFQPHPAFIKTDGSYKDAFYIGAYHTYDDAGTGSSVSGQINTRSQTRATFRTEAEARGTGWHMLSYLELAAIQTLLVCEYQDYNSQRAIGNGSDASTIYGVTTGQSDGDGNHSVNSTDNASVADDYMAYRGIENLYGRAWQWVDGINVYERVVYLTNDQTAFDDDTSDGYEFYAQVPSASTSYQKELQPLANVFLPSVVTGGSSTTYLGDALWTSTGWRVAYAGGSSNYGARNGAFCLVLSNVLGDSASYIGSRLCYAVN